MKMATKKKEPDKKGYGRWDTFGGTVKVTKRPKTTTRRAKKK